MQKSRRLNGRFFLFGSQCRLSLHRSALIYTAPAALTVFVRVSTKTKLRFAAGGHCALQQLVTSRARKVRKLRLRCQPWSERRPRC
jgi:hypothetical protein